ncbi:MAG: DUF5682 family protein [Pseudoclavibacter sp.]|nr:DUF5682 family protein [Pseudoclavibacter sp.]
MSELHLLGVRHHGPGSARSVAQALTELDPQLVLVEGPPELDAVTAILGDPDLEPPVAGLVYAAERPGNAFFSPLASFSPEWVAMRWALRSGAAHGWIDLPAANALAVSELVAESAGRPEPDGSPEDEAPAQPDAETEEAPRSPRRDPIGALARLAGYDDAERWWEDAVEQRTDSPLDRFRAIAESVGRLREDEEPVPAERLRDAEGALLPHTVADALGEGMTALREAAMRKALRAAIRAGHERIVVVCGAWHVPALELKRFPATADNRLLRGLPKTKVQAAWVPWTASRLGYASGYGAGVASPGWYRHLYEHWASGASGDVAASWLVRVARALRAEGLDASTASAVEAARLASTLAAVRGRPAAGLSELEDAALSVLADGDPVPLQLVHEELVVGRELGRVPDSAPVVPLAADLQREQRAARLKPSARQQTVTLDLRTPGGLNRSVLLHRLRMLGVGWGELADAGRGKGTFKESWLLEWRPELSVAIVEASLYGTTLAGAAEARAAELARSAASLQELSQLVSDCLLAQLPVDEAVRALQARSAVRSDAAELLGAIEPLAGVLRYGTVRGQAGEGVASVLRAIALRACIALPAAAHGIDEEAAVALRRAVESAHRGLALHEDAEVLTAWFEALRETADRPGSPGALAGRAVRLLLDAERMASEAVSVRMGRRLSPAAEARDAAGWLDGFLAGDAAVLVHDPGLLDTIDVWVASVPAAVFDDLLPLVRRTFSAFTRPERRMLGERLSGGAADEAGASAPIDPERARPAVAAAARILGWEVAA